MAGLLSAPMMSAYQVSKHSVVTLPETLQLELEQLGPTIGVSVLCPAFVQTELHESERHRPTDTKDESLMNEDLRQSLDQSVRALIASGKPPNEIADAVVDAIRERRLHIFTHPEVLSMFKHRVGRILEGNGG